MDIDSIPPGVDFPNFLGNWVSACQVLVVLIGQGWTHSKDPKSGLRRLDDPDDFVRIEIREALKRDDVVVVPVLIDAAQMPSADELPDDLKPLIRRNAEFVDFRTFDTDVGRLIDRLRARTGASKSPTRGVGSTKRLWADFLPKLTRPTVVLMVLLAAIGGYRAYQISAVIGPARFVSSEGFGRLASEPQEIKRVVDTLLNQSAFPPALGRDHAVAEAVTATIEGAAAGDMRELRILQFLKSGNSREAEPLLRAVAEERDRLEASLRHEAAAAYRRLGAIAALGNVKSAREAYGRAVERDPGDRESLYWHGWLQLLAGDLNTAERDLKRLLQQSAAAGDEHGTFRAHLRLGQIALERGNLQEAREHEDQALEIAKRNVDRGEAASGWLRDLSDSYEKIGDILVEQRNYSEALKFYGSDSAIVEGLIASEPEKAEWRYDLGIVNERIGDVRYAQGDLVEAAKSYAAKQKLISRLAGEDPNNVSWRRDLSVSYERMGQVQLEGGGPADALASFSNALAIREDLTKADPQNAEWSHDVSVSYAKLASFYQRTAQIRQAEDALAMGRNIILALATEHPERKEWTRDLAWFDEQIAKLKNGVKDPGEVRKPNRSGR